MLTWGKAAYIGSVARFAFDCYKLAENIDSGPLTSLDTTCSVDIARFTSGSSGREKLLANLSPRKCGSLYSQLSANNVCIDTFM